MSDNLISKFSTRVTKGYSNMSRGQKIYASFWLITGIFLVTFIGVVASFAPRITETVYNAKNDDGTAAHYSYTVRTGAPTPAQIGLTDADVQTGQTPMPGVTNLQQALDSANDEVLNNTSPTQDPWRVYDLTKAAGNDAGKDAEGKQLYYYTWGDAKNTKGQWTSISKSADAKTAQNGIAGIGLAFGISLMAAVFSTVIVSVRKKGKNKMKDNKGGKK